MLIPYSASFVAYLLKNLKELNNNIQRIVLYGSVARNEATKESDIDIFIEVKKKNQRLEKEINSIEHSFYESREAALFKLKNITQKFSIKVGILKEWQALSQSIASTGIVLYGYYEAKELPSDVQHNIILFWDKIGKNRGAFLNKLYGFNVGKKSYAGLIARFNGKKLGKSCVMFPIAYKKDMFSLIKKYQVHAKVIEVFR